MGNDSYFGAGYWCLIGFQRGPSVAAPGLALHSQDSKAFVAVSLGHNPESPRNQKDEGIIEADTREIKSALVLHLSVAAIAPASLACANLLRVVIGPESR